MPLPNGLSLSPPAMLACSLGGDGGINPGEPAEQGLAAAFARGPGHGLVHLGGSWPAAQLEAGLGFWRDLAKAHLTLALTTGGPPPPPSDWSAWLAAAPPMVGGEYLSSQVLDLLWFATSAAATALAAEAPGQSLAAALAALDPRWDAVGRVCLSLAENRADPVRPFAMIATYTLTLAGEGKPRHAPLARALADQATLGQTQQAEKVGAVLKSAGERSGLVRSWLESRRIFQPQALTVAEAHRFLQEVPLMEEAGLMVRVPDWWNAANPPRPRVNVTVGEAKPAGKGLGTLLDFKAEVALCGQPLTPEEWRALREAASGLVFLRGRWVEADADQIQQALAAWRACESLALRHGMSFAQAMRLAVGDWQGPAGVPSPTVPAGPAARGWSEVAPGTWLREALEALREPVAATAPDMGIDLRATLRGYQETGLAWLWRLHELGLGGCLGDDMGLGKTLQVLALFVALKRAPRAPIPHLVVAPATLVPTWLAEAAKFAPGLRVYAAHPSQTAAALLRRGPGALAEYDLVVTSYGALLRYPWLQAEPWDVVAVDEAQAIKNPAASQTRAVKGLNARQRLALTGTPVENRPLDLWSLFDFITPGLLGNAAQFEERLKSADGARKLRALVKPYILRRLKTDKALLPDLPDKTELDVLCGLTPAQAAIYERVVADLRRDLTAKDGLQRKGAILTALLRLKQVCDHPALVTGDGDFAPEASGKLQRLAQIAEEIAARQEKLLVFTQFRDMTAVLDRELARIFRRPGLVLHGGTPVRERQAHVERFQAAAGPPYFVLSLKAGGTGLTLTAAAHVVHFDRWWNPAVEDQATDRAYRIGQRRNVLVHKFTCAGTVEAKVAALLAAKRAIATELLTSDAETVLTELGDQELLALVALDITKAACEAEETSR